MKILTKSSDSLDHHLVGFKFSRQAKMRRDGFPIPPFYCIPVTVFDHILSGLKKTKKIQEKPINTSREALLQWGANIRQQLIKIRIEDPLKNELIKAFEQLKGQNGYVAVRTCGVADIDGIGEDSEKDPFAGLSDSFLYVNRDNLLHCIARCWASAFNDEALLYRVEQGMSPLDVRVAVGIQTMINGCRSFVAFTLDPRDATNRCVIASAYGIGEGVVQDKADTDHYFYDRNNGSVTSTVISKYRQVVQDTFHNYGVVMTSVQPEKVNLPVLNDNEVRTIANMALQLENYFSAPQDIEGTITEDGDIYIVQARPIAIDFRLWHIWSNHNITESFPGTTTALTYSFSQLFYTTIFGNLYRRLGVKECFLRKNEKNLQQMTGFINGRIYYRLDSWYMLHNMVPVFPFVRSNWERMMGIDKFSLKQYKYLSENKNMHSIPDTIKSTIRALKVLWSNNQHMQEFEKWWTDAFSIRRNRRMSRLSPLARIEDFYTLWREVGEWWGVTLINDIMLSCSSNIVMKILSRYFSEESSSLFNDLLCGDEENKSSTILFSIINLAEQARKYPDFLEEKDDDKLYKSLTQGEFGQSLQQSFFHHLYYYGDRGLEELKLEQTGMRQDPKILIRLIRHYATLNLSVDEFRQKEKTVRQAVEQKIKHTMGHGSLYYYLLLWLIRKVRLYVRNRENSRYCRSELFGYARTVCQSLSEDLVLHGVISELSDVYHLTIDELFGYFEGTGCTHSLQVLSDARRSEFEHPNEGMPELFCTYEAVPQSLPNENTTTLIRAEKKLQGLGSSRGIVRGIARVVLDPHQAITTNNDMILIARETDPGWLFLMLTAKGIIVERGTMLSHTAITSRKFGIPSIVSLSNATKLIPDGSLIEINGSTGVVTILSDNEG